MVKFSSLDLWAAAKLTGVKYGLKKKALIFTTWMRSLKRKKVDLLLQFLKKKERIISEKLKQKLCILFLKKTIALLPAAAGQRALMIISVG